MNCRCDCISQSNMAASGNFNDCIDELIKCSICLDDLVNPRSLPCLHTFCLKCIHNVFKRNLPGGYIACPICRHKFFIPQKGIEQLPSNFFIKSLIDAKKTSGKSPDSESCDVCTAGTNSSTFPRASMCCKTCGQKLCDRCSKPHQTIHGEAHQIVPLSKEMRKELLRRQGGFCSTHSGNTVKIYCADCRLNVCDTCHDVKHKTHDCHDISDIYDKFRQTLDSDIKQVSSKETNILRERESLEKKHSEFARKIQDIEREIRNNAAELKRRIDEIVDQLYRELADNKRAALKVINEQKSQLDFSLAAMQSFTRYSRELINSGKEFVVTEVYHDLHARADDLMQGDLQTNLFCLPEIVITAKDIYRKLSDHVLAKSSRK
jgi:Zinc finger, C3HC4 type (RING finger)